MDHPVLTVCLSDATDVSTSYICLTDFVEIGGRKTFLKLIYNTYDEFLKYN